MSETTGLQLDAKTSAELKARGVLASIGSRVMVWMADSYAYEDLLVSVDCFDHESGLREVARRTDGTDNEMEWIAAVSAYVPALIHDYELLLAVATAASPTIIRALQGEPISQVPTTTATTIDQYADVDGEPWVSDVPLTTVPGQVTGLADACLSYRVAECCYAACVARWGDQSDEAMLAAETVHYWGRRVFFTGGDADDIGREQAAVTQEVKQ